MADNTSTVYPSSQEISIDPYNGKLFDFNNYQSRVYLGRSINSLLKVFGDNCIIDGMRLTVVTLESNLLTCVISPGKIIIDTTLIEFKSDIVLELDLSNIDMTNGDLVISIAFNYLRDKFDNFAKFRLVYVDKFGNAANFFPEADNIILSKLTIDKERSFVDYTPSVYTNGKSITINNRTYKIFPADSITKNIINSISTMFFT